jgi:hypothetical protein
MRMVDGVEHEYLLVVRLHNIHSYTTGTLRVRASPLENRAQTHSRNGSSDTQYAYVPLYETDRLIRSLEIWRPGDSSSGAF